MQKLCIVLASQEPSFGEALRVALKPYPELHLVTQVKDELAAAIVLRDLLSQRHAVMPVPVVILTSMVDRTEEDPACTRLLLEFPELFLYAVHPGCMKKYRLYIETQELPESAEGLVEDLRSLSLKPTSPMEVVRSSPAV